jgi:hypothetical protein
MITEKNTVTLISSPKEIVMSCIGALNEEDFTRARSYVSDTMKFEGVLGSRDGADAYFNDMKKMKLKYEIKKVFEDSNDVCLLYNLDISGVSIFCCGWYHVEDGKIDSLKVVFDPRPVLDKQGKNN